MADSEARSFAGHIQSLMKNEPDFFQRFKQRLVFESSKVANPFKFIGGLLSKGVLCDGSNDSEASFGLKEWMVQLATTLVCSKGADAIGGLMEALEESGNLQLISALQTWLKQEFAFETDDDLSEPKGAAAATQTGTSKKLPKNQLKSTTASDTNGAKLMDKIISRMEGDFIEKLEVHWLGKASKIVNFPEFCSILANQEVLNESDIQLKSEKESKQEEWAQKVIKAAVSKRAIASLILAFQLSGNEHILQETQHWLEASQIKKKNQPVAVKNLRDQPKQEKPKILISQFFQQAPPSNLLEKVATFNCSPEHFTKGKFDLKFDKEKMMACFSGGTVKLWNWSENKENTTKFGSKDKDMTVFQCDEEILVLGTAAGTVHLFDAKKLEEKWSDRIGEPVHSLKLAKSTLVVVTRIGTEDKIWWVEISRLDMRLLNRRPVMTISKDTNYGFLIDYYSYLYYSNVITIRYSKTGESYPDRRGHACWMEAPGIISTLNVLDLIGAKSCVVAGCKNGFVAIWHTYGASALQRKPVKSFQGHQGTIVGLAAINGHLLSACEGGKLLMWSGHDLQNQRLTPIPRVLSENLSNITCLVACERWFASTSSDDSIINIWALPELWLRTG